MSGASASPEAVAVPSQSGSAGPPSGSSSQQPPSQPRSYATATKTSSSPPAVASSVPVPPVTVAVSQHGHTSNMSTSGSSATGVPPVVGNGAPPNGAPASSEHGRKPSVTIGASGASGYIANGGPVGSSAQRRTINFGQMSSDGSPAVANSSPYAAQSSLATPQTDPRISSPAASPTPIPTPGASGGRPPSGLPQQSNGLSFGSIGGSDNDLSRSMHATPPGSLPAQPVHLNRQPSQQSDMGNPGMPYAPQGPNRGQFMPGAGRGRGYPQGNFGQQQMGYGANPNYRPQQNQQRPGQGFPAQFQNQQSMPPFGSPHSQSRSPMPQGSHPGTPHMQHQQMAPNQMPYQYPTPPYHVYQQHLGPQAGEFGQQPGFNPNYGYYQGSYQMPPQYLGQGPPPSPRPFKQAPPTPHQQFVQGQFNNSGPQAMSRSPSHASTDRPASTAGVGGPPQPPSQASSVAPRSHTPSQSTGGTPAQSANFTLPAKRPSKGVVIKDASGNIITFDKDNKGKSSPAPTTTKSSSPSNVSAAPTPPPQSSTPHSRTESKTGKTAEEIRAEFIEAVKKEQSEDRIKEEDSKAVTSDSAAATTKADTDAEAAKAKEEADAKAAEDKRQAEEAEAEREKQEAEAVAAKEKEEKAKADAEAARLEAAESAAAAEAAKAAAAKAEEEQPKGESEAEPVQTAPEAEAAMSAEDEEMERMIAEMEAKEREDEERERAYQEKKKKEAELKAAAEKEAAARADEDMKRAEREAEEAEEARQQQKPNEDDESEEAKAEREKEFASLSKPTIGPGAGDTSEVSTPATEEAPAAAQRAPSASRHKPAALKLDTAKQVEPAQPTAGMQSLKSARMLQLQSEEIKYPEGIKSPNPAQIQGARRAGRVYDTDFLMQFQEVFKEKPSVDWEQKLKETIGDGSDNSAGPRSAKTPMTSRASSQRGPPPSAFQGMGNFGAQPGGRTLPPGTTSQARFDASNNRGPTMSNPLAGFAGRPGAFPMGNMPMPISRQGSMQAMPSHQSPRNASQRGKSARQDRVPSRKEQEQANKAMPLTASGEVKALETSKSGWKPPSVAQGGQGMASAPDPTGRMAPDMVQRKVKSALNKMTPERFDRISDQILEIAAQSKDETDGRTLRQIIALTFEKACDEAHWASMYAKFCARMMETMTTEIKDETITDKHGNPVVGGALFRKYLLNRCQEEFEKGWEVNLPEQEEGKSEEAAMMSDEYYKAAAAKRKGLGLIQFIGELYKLQMLSTKIMHTCFHKLLDFTGMPDEAAIESLVKLMRTVGATMDMDKDTPAASYVNHYFERIEKIAHMPGLPSRMHFMLLDVIDLRKQGWRSKDDAKGPKTIQEIRAEAAAVQQQAELERQRQRTGGGGGRIPSGRGDSRGYGGGMPPPNVVQNQVATDELRRLQGRQSQRQASSGPSRPLGPTSMFSNRNSSGRQGLGPGGNLVNRGGDESGSSTRSTSKRDDKSNTFSALAGLEQNEGQETTPASSPQVTAAVPATAPAPAPEVPKPAETEPAADNA